MPSQLNTRQLKTYLAAQQRRLLLRERGEALRFAEQRLGTRATLRVAGSGARRPQRCGAAKSAAWRRSRRLCVPAVARFTTLVSCTFWFSQRWSRAYWPSS
jgi:hypothetical protein